MTPSIDQILASSADDKGDCIAFILTCVGETTPNAAKLLNWSENRIRRTKAVLIELGLITGRETKEPQLTLIEGGRNASAKALESERVEMLLTLYPKQGNAIRARKAIRKALCNTAYEVLKSAVENYRATVADYAAKYISAPEIWFERERWHEFQNIVLATKHVLPTSGIALRPSISGRKQA